MILFSVYNLCKIYYLSMWKTVIELKVILMVLDSFDIIIKIKNKLKKACLYILIFSDISKILFLLSYAAP